MLRDPSPEAPVPFGRYELIRRIGAGGMGEVFLARESGTVPRACVVKKVLPHLVANRAFVGRFLDEAKVVVRLKHQNIARVYAMGDVAGEYFLAMEYVQGKTVSRFTKRLRDRKAEMPMGVALLIAERVCQGLQYAHEATDESGSPLALVHRDLSPANVCISYKGDIKIIDFGAAQSTLKEEQTAPRVVIGNLTYMAPEQAKKQIVDGRADIYSCGVMLWELLAWHALPQKGDPIERWRRAANPQWDAPSTHQRAIPRDVDQLVLKALSKDANDRWPNAAAFGEALRKARMRHCPEVGERDVAELLSRSFHREKVVEDGIVAAAVAGRSAPQVDPDTTRRVQFVPPTALAFEHTAVLAPVDFNGAADETTDPNRPVVAAPPPTEAPSAPVERRITKPFDTLELTSTRKSFGMTFSDVHEPLIEASLIEEIDATGAEVEAISDGVSRATPLGRWTGVVLFGGIFCLAVSLGFLAVWFALQS